MYYNSNIEYFSKNKKIIKSLIIIFLFILLYSFITFFNNKDDIIIHISANQPLNSVLKNFEEKNIIKDDIYLRFFIKILNNGKGIVPGDYLIKGSSPVWSIAWQISQGHHNVKSIKITIREGLNNKQITGLLKSKLTNFDEDLFLSETINKQGYLFPDTYFFFPMDTVPEIIDRLSSNFKNRIKDLPINVSDKNLSDIIIMASILEGEAKGKEDIYIISGILWKRISIGMPLQVDIEKLTYDTVGLPMKPLNNPGLLSIRAALLPINSSHLYYIHDKNGKVYYASTYDEHKRNIKTYLTK